MMIQDRTLQHYVPIRITIGHQIPSVMMEYKKMIYVASQVVVRVVDLGAVVDREEQPVVVWEMSELIRGVVITKWHRVLLERLLLLRCR